MKTIYIDIDGTVIDTISIICNLYNYDYIFYPGFEPVEPETIRTWDFDELSLTDREHVNRYFCTPRFFENIKFMQSAKWIIGLLSKEYKIVFCSSGRHPNLEMKKLWVKRHFPYAEFIPVELPTYPDKSHVNMAGGIFIDDDAKNLITSSAEVKICFGKEYPWNENWNGVRCADWSHVYKYIKQIER